MWSKLDLREYDGIVVQSNGQRFSLESVLKIDRALFLSLTLAASQALAASVAAQSFPERPVKVLVPYAAGGNTDAIARLLGAWLSESLKQQFVIENRGGASGVIAMEAVKNAAPDGHTLVVAALAQLAIVPAMQKVKYDPILDFAAISNVGFSPSILTVNPKVPAKTVAELVAWAKGSKESLTYASGGQGSHMNLTMVKFLKQTNLDIAAVHLRGGSEPMNNVVAGHIPMAFMNASDVVQQAAAGTVRALAVTSKTRIIQMPDLPTMTEAGFPYVSTTWNGLFAPAATPKAIVDRLAAEVQSAVQAPTFQARLTALGVTPIGNRPEAFAKDLAGEIAHYGEIVRSAGLQEKPDK